MTGAAMTAAASDFSAVSVVFLVMMGGCAFGMALGYPPHWMVAAAVLFLFASGYVGMGIVVLVLAFTLRSYAPNLLQWLEGLNIGETVSRSRPENAGYRRSSGAKSKAGNTRRRETREEARYNYDDMFGSRAQDSQAKSKSKGRTPEMVLGVRSGFTKKDLDAARRRLAKKFHPDLHRKASPKKQEHMAAKMRAVNDAYETLKVQLA